MNRSQKNRVRLSLETLEHRDAPASLTISAPAWIDHNPNAIVKEVQALAKSGEGQSHDRPFHAVDSGSVVIGDPSLPPGTIITASASGQATHLGAFTLNDTSMVVEAEGAIRSIEGTALLTADNGDFLRASFTGTVDLATFTATVTFEWTGGTGRFADASGTTVWHVTLNPADLTYTAVAEGDISY